MMRTSRNILLMSLPSLWNCFHSCLLKTRNFTSKGIGLTQRKEFGKECHSAFRPSINSFSSLVEPLLCLSQKRKRKQLKTNSILRYVLDDNDCTKVQKPLKVCVGILMWQSTERTCLHHINKAGLEFKSHISNISLGSKDNSGGNRIFTKRLLSH